MAQLAFGYAGRDDLVDKEYARSHDLAGDHNVVELMALMRLWDDGEPAAIEAQMRRVVGSLSSPVFEQVFAVFDDRDAALALLWPAVADDTLASGPGQAMLAAWLDHYGDPAPAAEALYRAFIEYGHGLYTVLHSTSPAVRR